MSSHVTQITSAANALFKRWQELSSSKGIRKHGEFILMGEKLIREFLRQPGAWKVRAELSPDDRASVLPRSMATSRFQLSPALFNELDIIGTGFPLLVLELPDFSMADLQKSPMGRELVLPLGDPSNLGAVCRSALAFGVRRILLSEEAAHPFHPKAVKASAGAVLRLEFAKFGRLKDYVATGAGFALNMQGLPVSQVRWPANGRLIVGEEGPGLPNLPNIQAVCIPIGEVESLNATVAASLALYEWNRAL